MIHQIQREKIHAPKELWQVSKLMMRLASNVYAGMRIAHTYKVRTAKLEQERNEKMAEKKKVRDELIRSIFSFVKSRKNEIVPGQKSVQLATGQVGWRKMAPAVEIAPGFNEEEVVARFQKRHKKFLRFTPKLNRQAILQAFQDKKFRTLTGITIRDREEFFISLAPRGKDKPETITIPMD